MTNKRNFAMIIFSGTLWMAVGVFLLSLGIHLLLNVIEQPSGHYPLATSLSPYLGGHETVTIILIAVGLLIGYFKATRILHKVAHRNINLINALPADASVFKIFGLRYWLLIAIMMGIGMGIRFFGVPDDIRGFVDVAVGAALINGSIVYYRSSLALNV